jgi:hypothetical protein
MQPWQPPVQSEIAEVELDPLELPLPLAYSQQVVVFSSQTLPIGQATLP